MTLGTKVTQSSLAANAAAVYSFSGSAGQQLYYDALSNTGSTSWMLLTADGTSAVTTGSADTSSGPFMLPENGTYYLVETNTDSNAASIAFNLLDVAAQPIVKLDQTATGTLDAGSGGTFTASRARRTSASTLPGRPRSTTTGASSSTDRPARMSPPATPAGCRPM